MALIPNLTFHLKTTHACHRFNQAHDASKEGAHIPGGDEVGATYLNVTQHNRGENEQYPGEPVDLKKNRKFLFLWG